MFFPSEKRVSCGIVPDKYELYAFVQEVYFSADIQYLVSPRHVATPDKNNETWIFQVELFLTKCHKQFIGSGLLSVVFKVIIT